MLHRPSIAARRTAILACASLAIIASLSHARAASPDAWEEFRENVRESCVAAAQNVMEVTGLQIDPFGSDSYGFAVLIGYEKDNPTQRMVVCAFNKQTETAEISGLLDFLK